MDGWYVATGSLTGGRSRHRTPSVAGGDGREIAAVLTAPSAALMSRLAGIRQVDEGSVGQIASTRSLQ